MSQSGFWRQLAKTVVGLTGLLLPTRRVTWGEAMENELSYIEEDWAALQWALGCFVVAFGERIHSMRILDTMPARLIMALVIAFKVLDDLFATAMTVAYRVGALGVAAGLGKQTPGDDYSRLVPLMQAIPFWLHALWILAAALFLVAMIFVLLRRAGALFLVLAAMGVEIVAEVAGRPLIAATGVVVNPNPSLVAAVVIPYIIPLTLAAAIWLAGRGRAPVAHQQ